MTGVHFWGITNDLVEFTLMHLTWKQVVETFRNIPENTSNRVGPCLQTFRDYNYYLHTFGRRSESWQRPRGDCGIKATSQRQCVCVCVTKGKYNRPNLPFVVVPTTAVIQRVKNSLAVLHEGAATPCSEEAEEVWREKNDTGLIEI